MSETSLPTFDGDIVIVYLADAPSALDNGVIIEKPTFQTINGTLYLQGTYPDLRDNNWAAGAKAGILWSSVIHWISFDTITDYLERSTPKPAGFWKKAN